MLIASKSTASVVQLLFGLLNKCGYNLSGSVAKTWQAYFFLLSGSDVILLFKRILQISVFIYRLLFYNKSLRENDRLILLLNLWRGNCDVKKNKFMVKTSLLGCLYRICHSLCDGCERGPRLLSGSWYAAVDCDDPDSRLAGDHFISAGQKSADRAYSKGNAGRAL